MKPAFPPRAFYTAAESQAYGVGWYAALLRCSQVLEAAVERFERQERDRRRQAREKKSA